MNRYACLTLLPALIAAAHAADGGLDPAFGTDGIARIDEIQPEHAVVATQPDGRILVCDAKRSDAGTGYDFYVVRFDADGTRDTTFGTAGALVIPFEMPDYGEDFCHGIAVQSDGHIVAVGERILADFPDPLFKNIAVARIDADGTLDEAFGNDGRLSFAFDGFTGGGMAMSVTIDGEDRIVVAGEVQGANYEQRAAVARIESDGTFDPTFGIGGQATIAPPDGSLGEIANAVALDAEGRILVALARAGDAAVMRLTSAGSPDATFGDGGVAMAGLDADGAVGSFAALAIDSEGRYVAAGMRQYQDVDYHRDTIAMRFLADGSRDPAFGDGGVAAVRFELGLPQGDQSDASAVAIEPDGRIVLAGYAVRPFPDGYLGTVSRLDDDGALDPTFGENGEATYDLNDHTRADQFFSGVAMQGTRIVVVGSNVDFDAGRQGDFVLRLATDRIFAGLFD